MLVDKAFELFFSNGKSLFIACISTKVRDEAIFHVSLLMNFVDITI